jgi:hypothetical protein
MFRNRSELDRFKPVAAIPVSFRAVVIFSSDVPYLER